mgnify:FL=1
MTERTPAQIKQDRQDFDRDMRKLEALIQGKPTSKRTKERWPNAGKPYVMSNWR